MIGFKITSEKLTLLQQRATEAGIPGPAAQAAGAAVKLQLVEYFAALDESRANALGGKRTHFWADVARSVQGVPVDVNGGTAFISINHLGLAQRLLGGTITAGTGISSKTGLATKFISVPTAETYGQTPGEAAMEQDMAFVPTKRGGALVQGLKSIITRGKNKGQETTIPAVGGLVLYWLVPELTQDPDPTVLPTEFAMANQAADAMENFINRKLSTN